MPLGALADAAMLARVRQQLRLSPADIDVIGSFQPPRSNRQNTSGPAPPLFLINWLLFCFFPAGFDCGAVSAGDLDSIRELRRFNRSGASPHPRK